MRLFASEIAQSYDTYSFAYCPYALREPTDCLADIYDEGFLPYSGSRDITDVFYMARSVRLSLPDFALNSENRRIAKRFNDQLTCQRIPFADFDTTDATFIQFCLAYFAERHGPRVMPAARLQTILSSNLITDILVYSSSTAVVAYVFEVSDTSMSHFWYSFYDLAYSNQSLGLWLMTDAIVRAQQAKKTYYYLGTAYGEKGLYKTNFESLAYWNGYTWVMDRQKLRDRCKSDTERTLSGIDEWKDSHHDRLFVLPPLS